VLLEAMALLVERPEERVGEGIAVPKPSLATHVAVLEKVGGCEGTWRDVCAVGGWACKLDDAHPHPASLADRLINRLHFS
jgi:hypothetical protein